MPDKNQMSDCLTALPDTNTDRPPSRTARSRALPALNLDLSLALTPALQTSRSSPLRTSHALALARSPTHAGQLAPPLTLSLPQGDALTSTQCKLENSSSPSSTPALATLYESPTS